MALEWIFRRGRGGLGRSGLGLGLERANIGETFLYYALSYDDSVRRAVAWQLRDQA
ncbi:MAG TPA: hypothetical protein VM869_36065 [Enhygromyxa sp.]|nr:hypothetical protein [Enhygromyxa sp.]